MRAAGRSFGTSPIIVNQAVIVGSSSGQVYGLNAATGAQLWTTNAGRAISAGNGNVISALAAGDGLLVVPAGSTLSAFTLSTNRDGRQIVKWRVDRYWSLPIIENWWADINRSGDTSKRYIEMPMSRF